MAMKKELRDGLEEIRAILSGLEMIHPNNKMDTGRKGLGSTALSEIIPDCASMIENIIWCDRYNTPLKD